MSYITRIEIEDFKGLRGEMDIAEPINVIFGRNGAGKSTIGDALYWAMTGKLEYRGYTRKNQAKQLGAKPRVDLFTEAGQLHRDAKNAYGDIPAKLDDPIIAAAILNPLGVLNVPAKKRGQLFEQVFGGEMVKAAYEEYVRNTGFSPESTNMLLSGQGDMDKLLKWATDAKRTGNRYLKENNPEKPSAKVEIDGKAIDLSGGDAQQKLSSVRQELAKRQSWAEEMPKVKSRLAESEAKLKALSVPKLRADYDTAQAEHIRLDKQAQTARQAQNKVEAEVQFYQLALEVFKTKKSPECLLCNRTLTLKEAEHTAETLQARINIAKGKLTGLRTQADDAEVAWRDNSVKVQNAHHACDKAKDDIAYYHEQIARDTIRLQANGSEPDKLNQKIAELQKGFNWWTKVAAAQAEYRVKLNNYNEYSQRMAVVKEKVAEHEAIESLLKPGGELRKIAASGVQQAQFDPELVEVWGYESLSLLPTGEIELFGRPLESASASEQWRAALLISELLARTLELPVLVIDGLEILDKTLPVQRRLKAWLENYSTILVNIATAETPQVKTIPDMAYWQVSDGTISEVS